MAAALFAAIAGSRWMLIERTDQCRRGTTAYSAGARGFPIQPTPLLSARMTAPEKAALYLRIPWAINPASRLRQAFLTNGPEAVAQLEAHSEVKFRARQLHPDYNSQLPGSS